MHLGAAKWRVWAKSGSLVTADRRGREGLTLHTKVEKEAGIRGRRKVLI